mgnify:CR=1 FL=1
MNIEASDTYRKKEVDCRIDTSMLQMECGDNTPKGNQRILYGTPTEMQHQIIVDIAKSDRVYLQLLSFMGL